MARLTSAQKEELAGNVAKAKKDLDEARLEISGKAGVLLSETAGAMPAKEEPANGERAAVQPVVFFYPRNLRDDPLPKLMDALAAGETLSLKVTAADGGLILQDAIYAFGYEAALKLLAALPASRRAEFLKSLALIAANAGGE